ncbi:MAG: response regulator [Bacteroidales bacterium]|nr:response regulator [Bacteroidales bacterium]MBN2750393.1 response regulator [Bacteroidales bacterium]
MNTKSKQKDVGLSSNAYSNGDSNISILSIKRPTAIFEVRAAKRSNLSGVFPLVENAAFKDITSKYSLCSCTSNFWSFVDKKTAQGDFTPSHKYIVNDFIFIDLDISPLGNNRYLLLCTERHGAASDTETASHMKFLTLFSEGYWIWDIEKGIIEPDATVKEALKGSVFKFDGKNTELFSIIHANDRKQLSASIKRLVKGEADRCEIEFRVMINTSQWQWRLGRWAVSKRNKQGKPTEIIGVTLDIDENVRNRLLLHQSEHRLRRAQSIARIGSWESDPKLLKAYWSDEVYHILGFEVGSVVPSIKTIYKYIHADDFARLKEQISSIATSSAVNKLEYDVRYKGIDKQRKMIRFTFEAVRDSKGDVDMWQGVVQDVTALHKYESSLKQERDNLTNLINNIPAIVLATSSKGEIVFWNRSGELITGYSTDDAVDNPSLFSSLFPDSAARREMKRNLKESAGSSLSWENQITTASGAHRHILWATVSDFVKLDGWHAIAIGYDITKRKQAESMQELNRKKLEALSETAIDFVGMPINESIYHYVGTHLERFFPKPTYIVFSFDSQNSFVSVEGVYGVSIELWNKVLASLGWNPIGRRFPLSQESMDTYLRGKMTKVDATLFDFADGVLSVGAAKELERLLGVGKISTIGMIKHEHLYGGVIVFADDDCLEMDFSLVEGLVSQASVALYRQELENQLIDAKNRAEQSDRLKSAFLANMSHEIRTPMNAILGFSQLLAMPSLSDDKRLVYTEIINNKGNILIKLINDIIDASKVEAGQLTVVLNPFNLNKLLANINLFYQKEKVFQNRENVEIRLVIPNKEDALEFLSDEGRIEQVFTNLISNALKFTERGFIEFGYSLNESHLKFYVKDSGVGIPTDMQQAIFDRFRQVDSETTKNFGGTGLGLAISKAIVNLLGGSIWVESELAEGATFYFTIPYNSSTLHKTESLPEVELVDDVLPDWKNRVVLIAEDEEVNYILLSELLTPTGVTLLWAKDGAQAVELIKKLKRVDLILMDIKMPVMNGYAATLEIRQVNPHIPIIAQTAYAFSNDKQKAEAAGCNDYITKPISSAELIAKMSRFLGD